MNQLDELYDYKNQFMGDILTDPKIVDLLTDEKELIENPKKLVYSQVFPFEYIPETVEHGKVYICCDVDIRKSVNKTYLLPDLYIWVFAHKSKLKLPGGGVVTDRLVAAIADKLNGSRYYGLGELDLYSVKRFAPTMDYQGKVMTFQAIDTNRLSPTNKAVPSNRKRG